MTGETFYQLRDNAPEWLVDHAGDEIFSIEDAAWWLDLPTWIVSGIVRGCADPWEMVASVDHGLRCADETMANEIAHLAELIMGPVLAYIVGPGPMASVDTWGALCDELDYGGDGWIEPTDDDPHAERMTWAYEDIVWHRSYDQIDDIIVETSGDAGMTWIYVRKVPRDLYLAS